VTVRTIHTADSCCRCRQPICAGSRVGWDEWTRNVTCLACAGLAESAETAEVPAPRQGERETAAA